MLCVEKKSALATISAMHQGVNNESQRKSTREASGSEKLVLHLVSLGESSLVRGISQSTAAWEHKLDRIFMGDGRPARGLCHPSMPEMGKASTQQCWDKEEAGLRCIWEVR
jgi:hypothetical protein